MELHWYCMVVLFRSKFFIIEVLYRLYTVPLIVQGPYRIHIVTNQGGIFVLHISRKLLFYAVILRIDQDTSNAEK